MLFLRLKHGRLPIALLTALVAFTIFSSSVFADTITVAVTDDTFITKAVRDNPYGHSDHMTVANTSATSNALIKFDTINLPPEAVIDQAVLSAYVTTIDRPDSLNLRIGPNQASPSLNEDTTTWNTRPHQLDDHTYDKVFSRSMSEGWRNFDITNLVRAWQDGSVANNGLYVTVDSDECLVRFASKESSHRPSLWISYHGATLGEDEPLDVVGAEEVPTDTPTPTQIPESGPTTASENTPNPTLSVTRTTQPTQVSQPVDATVENQDAPTILSPSPVDDDVVSTESITHSTQFIWPFLAGVGLATLVGVVVWWVKTKHKFLTDKKN